MQTELAVNAPSLRLELRTRNNRLWHIIFDNAKNVSAFCKKHDLCQGYVGGLLNLRKLPWLVRKFKGRLPGDLTPTAQRLVEISGLSQLDLFDPLLYNHDLIPDHPLVAEVNPYDVVYLADIKEPLALGPSPEEALDPTLGHRVRKVMATLTPREEKVVRMRFGISEEREYTLEEVGDYFDIMRERVRQIEGKALRKLRHPLRGGSLKGLLAATP
jgi:RNA polymerase sigma factor (sigma-70 family)